VTFRLYLSLSTKAAKYIRITLYTVSRFPDLPTYMNISTDKMADYTDFSLLQIFCLFLNISTPEYPTESSLYN
jgi:hypothetical protein